MPRLTALTRSVLGWIAPAVLASVAPAQTCLTWDDHSAGSGNPPVRAWPGMTYDAARHVTVRFGGYGGGANNNDTAVWNGTTWTTLTPPVAPSARALAPLVYDSGRQVCVLFGGNINTSGFGADTWEWTGTTWTLRTPAAAPGARYGHGMAYDVQRGVTVLFGGIGSGTGNLGDTWEYNGTTWTHRTPALSPPARSYTAMAYDDDRHVCVLFGGSGGGGADTWEWDGANWAHRTPAGVPPARDQSALVWDPDRHTILMVGGGLFCCNTPSDTWEYDGVTWTQRFTNGGLPLKYGHGLAYDVVQHQPVVYGGGVTANSNQTWQLRPQIPPVVTVQPLSMIAPAGAGVAFNAAGSGAFPLSYQWRKNGVPVPAATGTTLALNPVAPADAGAYDLVISYTGSGTDCMAVSTAATLTIGSGCRADFNGDGQINVADYLAFLSAYAAGCP
jgi:hypothetical protein